MNTLPNDILYYIYTFDDTYKHKYKEVVETLKERHNNLCKIKVFKLLITYNDYYNLLYQKRLKVLSIYSLNIFAYMNIYYAKLYNQVLKELLVYNKDTTKNLTVSIWEELFEISHKYWKKSHNEYKEKTQSILNSTNQYYFHHLRNNFITS